MAHQSRRKDMTQGPILSHALRMAIPMVIGIGAIVSFTIVDTYFIGQLGGTELAAIGFTMPVTTFLFNIIFGLSIAMSAVISRKTGAKLMDEVRQTASVGIAIAVLTSSVLALSAYLLIDPIFRGLGADETTLPYIRDYMPLWFISSVLLSVPMVANAAMRGSGNALWPSIIMVMIAVINGILDPILIFGWWGLPALGIQGAAVASLTAAMISAILSLTILGVREGLLNIKCLTDKTIWRSASKPLLVIAIPVSLGSLIAPIVSYLYTGLLADQGNIYVAGYGVASRLEAFILIPVMAVAGGIAPLIGQNYGAGLSHRVLMALKQSSIFVTLYAILSVVLIVLSAEYAANIFSDNAQIRTFIAAYLTLVPLSYIGLYLFAVMGSALNAMDRAKQSLAMNILKSFLIGVPLAFYLTSQYGADGFVWGLVVTNLSGLVIALIYIQRIRCALHAKTVS